MKSSRETAVIQADAGKAGILRGGTVNDILPGYEQCPKCKAYNQAGTAVCRSCGKELPKVVLKKIDVTDRVDKTDMIDRRAAPEPVYGKGKEFWQPCIPPTATAQQRKHAHNGITYQPKNVRRAIALLRAIFCRHKPAAPLAGPVACELTVIYPHIQKASARGSARSSSERRASRTWTIWPS